MPDPTTLPSEAKIAESKRSIDSEVLAWHVPFFILVYCYAMGWLGWPVFFLLFYPLMARIFITNHDRIHADRNRELPLVLDWLANNLALVVTPWDEPFDSYAAKHLAHHRSHEAGHQPQLDPLADPHSVYESGGLWRALLSAAFYDEIQFYLDVRSRHITRGRWVRMILFTPLILIFINYAGWLTYAGVLAASKITGAVDWFVFSYVLHKPYFFRYGFVDHVPGWLRILILFTHGRRAVNGILFHAAHHAWPAVASGRLHPLDDIARQHRERAPTLVTSR